MRKAFVAGHPIQHSRSPLIHGYWLREHAIAGAYERVDVPPEAFAGFLDSFPDRGFVGGNITIPYKESAFDGLQNVTELASRLGAVNTVWLEDGLPWGDNTDVLGFLAHLDQTLGPGWERDVGAALVLGAGGAARAVLAGLLDRGVATVFMANRTSERAKELERFEPGRVQTLAWDAIDPALHGVEFVVNTTSLGMAGQPPLCLDLSGLPDEAIVADIVYVPLETPLLKAARGRGLRVVDGLGMLLHQAVPGFERWFGVKPVVTPALRRLVVADLETHG